MKALSIGEVVKVFSTISEFDGQVGKISHITATPAAEAPYVVTFGPDKADCFAEYELASMQSYCHPETLTAPHGTSLAGADHLARTRTLRMLGSARAQYRKGSAIHQPSLRDAGASLCRNCGALFCECVQLP